MRKNAAKKRFAALGLATAMAISSVSLPGFCGFVAPMVNVQAAETETPVWAGEESIVFNTENDAQWEDKAYLNSQTTAEVGAAVKVTAKVTVDADMESLALLTDAAPLKFSGAIKTGASWMYCKSASYPTLTADGLADGSGTIEFTDYTPFDEADKDKSIAGVLCGVSFQYNVPENFAGTITVSDVKVYSETAGEEQDDTDYDTLLTDPAFAACAFNSASGWDEHKTDGSTTEFSSSAVAVNTVPKQGARVTADILIKAEEEGAVVEAPDFAGEIKFKGVMRLGDDWSWVQSADYPALSKTSFVQVGETHWYKAKAEWSFGAAVGANVNGEWSDSADFAAVVKEKLSAFTICCAGANSDFSGDLYVTNVKFTDGTVLVEQEGVTVADFAEGIDGWEGESGWDYSHGKEEPVKNGTTPCEKAEAAWDEDSQSLKMTVDYSKDAKSGWSEAKIKGSFDAVDVSNYNMVSFTLRYPSGMETVRTKLFMSDTTGETEVLNSEGSFRTKTVEDLGNGWSTVTIRAEFTPKNVEADSLTIGIVGPYADLSDVYIDDIVIGQLDASEDYVRITESVKGTVDTADLSHMAESVKLVDGNATKEAKALAAYLMGLQESSQVLFGHQNSTFRSVRTNGEVSDIKDITGSEAGLFGIDTLSLTGAECVNTGTQADRLNAAIAASQKAYEGGSIISLSCHMPNFTNKKIKATDDDEYPYDFRSCDFAESKDLTPCADYILEGGEYNPQFNAYLDIIAKYALALQDAQIPVLFRPFHENSGGWFWWGTSTSVESYQAMWRYMVNYLSEKGVHNFLYVYSPNGPISSEAQYLERYPGDAYVDVLGFDYYDDYADASVYTGDNYFAALAESCSVVADLAADKNKIPAIAETGIRITGAGKDSLMVTGNPTTGKDWYNQVINTAVDNKIPYFLLWANFDSANFFVPYKYNDTLGQEMINDFIKAYNNEKSIFGAGTNFYGAGKAVSKADNVTLNGFSSETNGYMITPKNYAVIKEPTTFTANVKNAESVTFVISVEGKEDIVLTAQKEAEGNAYSAALTAETLAAIGETSTATVTLKAGAKELGKANFINFNKDADVMPQHIFDDFEYYYGNNGLLQSKYGSHNSAAGCSASISLSDTVKSEGGYGGVFDYTLTYKGSEVWTGGLGRTFDEDKTDFSDYNAVSMWVKPDGNAQKVVFQLKSGSASPEIYLTEIVKGTEAVYVAIPFSAFVDKNSGAKVDVSNITGFALWCNSLPDNYPGEKAQDGSYTVHGQIGFDEICAVKLSDEDLAEAEENGGILVTPAVNEDADVAAVIEKINAIGSVSYDAASKARIDEAKAAYNALTEEQKAQVPAEIKAVLAQAEQAYNTKKAEAETAAEAEKKKAEEAAAKKKAEEEAARKKAEEQAANQKAADDVIAKINAIGEVTGDEASKAKIDEAKAAYEKLTEEQKKLVPEDVKKKLTDAETVYAEQKAKQDALVKKGKTITVKKQKFVVTKSDVKNGTVSYAGTTDKKAVSVKIPNTVTKNGITYKVTSIAKNALKGNKKITKVTIPSNVTKIGTGAFNGCKKLATVTMGLSVTEIGTNAFYKCEKLKKIIIPSKVKKIGKKAFYGCKALKNIQINTTKLTTKNVGASAFKGTPKNAVVKVPKSKVSAYKRLLVKKGLNKKATVKKR